MTPITERPTPESILAARTAQARERVEVVQTVGRDNPRAAVESIVVRYPEGLQLLNEFLGLCELHGYDAMAKIVTQRLARGGR